MVNILLQHKSQYRIDIVSRSKKVYQASPLSTRYKKGCTKCQPHKNLSCI